MTNLDAALKAYVERIESVETQIEEYTQDRKDIYTEAKSNGYDVAALKAVVKERARDEKKKTEAERRGEMIALYKLRLGMLSDLPLGQAAIDRAASL